MPATHFDRETVESWAILSGVVGSTAHGLAVEGSDDRDIMGVCVEPREFVLGLREFEHYIYRTAEERQPASGGRTPRSEAGDLDLTLYSLRKFARLAKQGNPSVLVLFYLPQYETITRPGQWLVNAAPLFASKQAAPRFLGYMQAQRERLMGERGQMRTTRADLIAKHGYDTKFAMHMLRLGYQGVEYLSTGRISLPMRESNGLLFCRDVRAGRCSYETVIAIARGLEDQVRELSKSSPLPDEPDHDGINRLLGDIYTYGWGSRGERW